MHRRWRTGLRALLILVAGQLVFMPVPAAQDEDLEVLFREGMQALEDYRLRSAREAFQAILNTDPSLHRARLELAMTYYRMLDYQQAETLARQVLEDPQTPTQVRLTITAFLAQVEADRARFARRHAWRASLAFGGMHDSNVNVGPSSEILADNIRLLPGFTRRSDNALFVQPGLSHTYNPGRRIPLGEQVASLLWQSQFSFYDREYHEQDDFNLNVVTLSTGPVLVALKQWRAGLNLTFDRVALGGDVLALFTTLQPHVTWQFERGELTLDAAWSHRRYASEVDSGREGDYGAFGGSLVRHFLDRRLSLQGGLHYLDFDADQSRWSYQGPELMLGASYNAWERGRLFARAVQRSLDYDGVFPPFGEARDERERRFTLGFSHVFAGGPLDRWRMQAEWQRVFNRSDVNLFEYDRSQVSLTFSRGFELGS
ncbi:tetratricopeptide repeat protein [Thiohalobacter thiocyanaticus]|uniref:tetratricopeptide repeat protein n=1 Tax=Thiohalobacter thiocyanaticus TaxID=585455 RepID=UPI000F634415|nr:hypothetical protein [Thiohalobacter thiocyanaticus]